MEDDVEIDEAAMTTVAEGRQQNQYFGISCRPDNRSTLSRGWRLQNRTSVGNRTWVGESVGLPAGD